MPTLLLYVQDKDLWTWELPDSRAISAYLSSREADFDTWDNIARDFETAEGCLRAVEAGKSIPPEQATGRPRNRPVSTLRASGRTYGSGGQLTDHASEIGEYLVNAHPESPFAAIYFDVSPTVRKWSLRSRGNGFDVSRLAQQFGGGGHPAAAGFSQSIQSQPPVVRADTAAVSNDVAWLQAVHLWSDIPSVT